MWKNMSENIVSVNNLSVSFDYQENFLSKKQKIKAVNNINIKIKKGSFFGLVGESGSGKTTLGRAILGANKISTGNVIFHDEERDFDLTTITPKEKKEYRKKAQLIFQDPYAALSPRMTVRDIIAEPLEVMKITKSRAFKKISPCFFWRPTSTYFYSKSPCQQSKIYCS